LVTMAASRIFMLGIFIPYPSINQGGIGMRRFGPDSQIDKKADFL
jgi:hypothetical protein